MGMSEIYKPHNDLSALNVARRIAGGPDGLALSMYHRYKKQSKHSHDLQSSPEVIEDLGRIKENVKRELTVVLRNPDLRKEFLTGLPLHTLKHVDKLRNYKGDDQELVIIQAFGYYALLAKWTQEFALEIRADLLEGELSILFALQQIENRLLRRHSVSAKC